jgi:hypothetical protein
MYIFYVTVQYDMLRYSTAWYGSAWVQEQCGTIIYDMVLYVRWCGKERDGIKQYGIVLYGMVWYDMARQAITAYGIV